MGEQNQQPNRGKTIDEVREERRVERIEAVQDPALRGELNGLLEQRENSLTKMKEMQRENRPSHEQQVKSRRLSPGSIAPAEVTLQFEGQLRGEAGRHNEMIDTKLQAIDQVYGMEFDEHRYAIDRLYRQVIDEEIHRDQTNKLQSPTNTLGSKASLEGSSPDNNFPQVPVDHVRLATDPDYRNQILSTEIETILSSPGAPDLKAGAQRSTSEQLNQILDNEEDIALGRAAAEGPKRDKEKALSATGQFNQALDAEELMVGSAQPRPGLKKSEELSTTDELNKALDNNMEQEFTEAKRALTRRTTVSPQHRPAGRGL